jgi:hypothetical protein
MAVALNLHRGGMARPTTIQSTYGGEIMAVITDFSYLGAANGWGTGSEFGTPFGIGDVSAGRFTRRFTTAAVRRDAPALLTMMVRALKDGTARVAIKTPNTLDLDPAIAPNGELDLGRISRQPSTTIGQDECYQQNFTIPSFILSRSQNANMLIIGRVASVPPTMGAFDDFGVREIYVFFKQDDD